MEAKGDKPHARSPHATCDNPNGNTTRAADSAGPERHNHATARPIGSARAAARRTAERARNVAPSNLSAYYRSIIPLTWETAASIGRRLRGQERHLQAKATYHFDRTADPEEERRLAKLPRGTVLAHEPLKMLGTQGAWNPARTERFVYVTRDGRGRPITATAAYARTDRPRFTPAPVIGFAPATQGVSPYNNPTTTATLGLAVVGWHPLDVVWGYEQPTINQFLALGCDVVFIDYPRDPATDVQYYGDNVAGGRSLLDAIRAAREFGLSSDASVGLWGYSQGGGTAGWCVENADMSIAAAVVGAPPSDMAAVSEHIDGGALTGVLAYSLASLLVREPEIRERLLSEISAEGLAEIRACLEGTPLMAIRRNGHTSTRAWTTSGKTVGEVLQSIPEAVEVLGEQRLGTKPARCPVLLWGGRYDDVIPIGQVREIARGWGEQVVYEESRVPPIPGRMAANHTISNYLNVNRRAEWLVRRL